MDAHCKRSAMIPLVGNRTNVRATTVTSCKKEGGKKTKSQDDAIDRGERCAKGLSHSRGCRERTVEINPSEINRG